MASRKVAAIMLAFATFSASGQGLDQPETTPLPELGIGLPTAALIAAGVAAAAAFAASGGGGSDSGGSAGAGGGSGAGSAPRSLTYTGAADFQTSEYAAQQGLGVVK